MSGRFRVGAALTGIVVLTAAGLIAANGAQADPRTGSVGDTELPVADQQLLQVQSQAQDLEGKLGSRAVGSYVDETGALVVAVTDLATADLVRQAGAIPRLVRFTADQLR